MFLSRSKRVTCELRRARREAETGGTAPVFAGPDGALLGRIAVAELFWAAYGRAEAEQDRLYDALRRHPERPETAFDTPEDGAAWDSLAERLGIPAIEARCERLAALCDAATRAAFDLPARTLPGARAKLRLGVAALKAEHRGNIEPLDCRYLDDVIADLERLGGG